MNFNAELKEISLDGFEVVEKKCFCKTPSPMMTFYETAISFNIPCITSLNKCESIRIMVNERRRTILVMPSASADSNAIVWNKSGKPAYTRLECSAFTKGIYDMWGLKSDHVYKAEGKVVRSDEKVMLLFDFGTPEVMKGRKKQHEK